MSGHPANKVRAVWEVPEETNINGSRHLWRWMLGFHDDALMLSGPTGSGLKTQILGAYYNFWWKIVSGGPSRQYNLPAAIVDMNAGTGELYLQQTGATILGSAGHALELKYNSRLPTTALKIVLVEQDTTCYNHLRNVVRRRWSSLPLDEATGPLGANSCGVYLMNAQLPNALDAVAQLNLGNAIFFFDPLLHVDWQTVEQVAKTRIVYPLQTGTEFIIFVFTSDWFTGRHYAWREELVALPRSTEPSTWSSGETAAVRAADGLFGDSLWRSEILNESDQPVRVDRFVASYKRRLLKWFRWILPLPFVPKPGQLYHLILCSNYDAGVHVTRDFFCDLTKNERYVPANKDAYARFRKLHPDTLDGLLASERPTPWKILWQILRYCEDGICDERCRNLRDQGPASDVREAMEWLLHQGYLVPLRGIPSPWSNPLPRYQIDWGKVAASLHVEQPPILQPATSKAIEGVSRRRTHITRF